MQRVHSLVTIAELQPVSTRSFVAFRSLEQAIKFVAKKGKGKLSKHQYGSDSRDIRYIVNYQGR